MGGGEEERALVPPPALRWAASVRRRPWTASELGGNEESNPLGPPPDPSAGSRRRVRTRAVERKPA